jgi:hypothetical protein
LQLSLLDSASRNPFYAYLFIGLKLRTPRSFLTSLVIMTNAKLPATHGTPFAPSALVPIAVGCTMVNLYKVIDPDMQVEECAHAYQINKTALASTPVDL